MFKNGVECISGVLTFKDIVQGHGKKQQKNNFGENSFLSGDNTIPSQKYELLHQV